MLQLQSASEENIIINFTPDITEDDIESQHFLSPFGEKVLEYIAGFVAFSLIKKNVKHALKVCWGSRTLEV